nr:hypothetical protein [Tanacetum cinerariifolium]
MSSLRRGATLIVDKTRKLENLIIDRKVTLVDDDGKPQKRLIIRVIMIVRMRDSDESGDYDEDPYDDDDDDDDICMKDRVGWL